MSISSHSSHSVDDKAHLERSFQGEMEDMEPENKSNHHQFQNHHLQQVGSTTASIPVDDFAGETDSPVHLTPYGTHDAGKLVAFHPGDKDDPKNWSKFAKWHATLTVSLICFVVAFSSSVVTSDIIGVVKEFHVSEEVALLSVSLFVVGFGLGPMIFAPLSELYGRKIIYSTTLFFAMIFLIPCAKAKNIQTLLVCRAIDGIAFSAPMTLVGGTLADMWRPEERGLAMATFSAAPFLGPVIGPVAGGFLSDAKGWRWLYWLQLILAGVGWIAITFTVAETYPARILAKRAAKLRKDTGDQTYTSIINVRTQSFASFLGTYLIRPFKLLFTELIVFLVSVYMSVLYGILYMYFVSFPVIFQQGKGYTAGITGLMFIPVAVGCAIGLFLSPTVNKDYLKQRAKYEGMPPAEIRLRPMMVGCWTLPIGLFITAWTSYPRLTWVGPALSGIPMGIGFVLLYNSANNYIVDSYQHLAASALAAKTFMRSLYGAGVVLFTIQMYHKLGYQWAGSLVAFISLACCAIPFLFYKYGATIRKRSKYAYSGDDEEQQQGNVSGGAEK